MAKADGRPVNDNVGIPADNVSGGTEYVYDDALRAVDNEDGKGRSENLVEEYGGAEAAYTASPGNYSDKSTVYYKGKDGCRNG